MDAAASPWPDPRPIGPPSKAVDTQALLDPRITQELPTLHRIAHDTVPSALVELDARLVKLGVSKLGQRLRMKTALIAAESLPALIGMVKKAQEASDAGKPIPAPAGDGNDSDSSIGSEFDEPEKEPEDLPNSNYAEEASALNSNMPWREEMKQDYGINIQPWWIVTGDRLAVRSAPSKGAKALGVWRKGTIVKVEHVESKLDLSGATSWVRLARCEHAFLGTLSTAQKADEATSAWMLSDDTKLGQTLTPCPELELEKHGIDADSLFDGSLHPEHRGADAAAKAKEQLAKFKAAEARVKSAEPQMDMAAESDLGMDVDVGAVGAGGRGAAEAPRPVPRELPSLPVVSFERAAGPPRPPGFPEEPEDAVG